MKKIMFNDKYGLTDAVLTGRKTMTRRIIPDIEIEWVRRGKVTLPVGGFEHDVLFMNVRSILRDAGISDYAAPAKYQPRYERGEEVAVAQSYKHIYDVMEEHSGNSKANEWWCELYSHLGDNVDPMMTAGYSNKMFVLAELMPHRIRITDIKTERLQDISEEDCLKEGVERWIDCYIVSGIMERNGKCNKTFSTPREAFANLIDRISGKGTWQRNPWVFAYTFELIK